MNIDDVGLGGAILEMNFDDLADGGKGATVKDEQGLVLFTVIGKVGDCPVPMYNEKGEVFYPKAITVMDSKGNIFVHFNGTGDGFWKENGVAAGGMPSGVQQWALDYFNSTVKNNIEGQSHGNLYVTGHSQGGNNAQFVTIRSPYSDYIRNCVSLDGPGFSDQFITDSKNLFGEAYYERQRDKIYGIYGEHDYASAYAQNDIIDPLHISFVKQSTQDQVLNPQDNPLFWFHAVEYMVHRNENGEWVWNDESNSSAFRELIIGLSDQIYAQNNDEESRRIMEILLGGVAEKFLGADYQGNLTSEDFEYLKEKLIPALVATIQEHPELVAPALQAFGFEGSAAESIADLIGHINTYPEEIREAILAAILQVVKYENGEFTFDTSKIPAAILAAWPVILETALTHPSDLLAVLHELGVDAAIGDWIKENPWQFAGICIAAVILAPIWIPIAKAFIIAGLLVDAIIRIVQGLAWLGGKIKDGLVSLFNALKNAITAFSQWFRNTFNAGVRYATANPYFKVDTAKLRNYATRINNVNNRLRSLDSSLRSCFWQVPVWEMWRFAWINMLTSGSPTLNQVKSYLNNSADRFETAENKARGNVGG